MTGIEHRLSKWLLKEITGCPFFCCLCRPELPASACYPPLKQDSSLSLWGLGTSEPFLGKALELMILTLPENQSTNQPTTLPENQPTQNPAASLWFYSSFLLQ